MKKDKSKHYFDDVVEYLQGIIDDIEKLRQKIVTECGVSYTSQDARHVALAGLQRDILACGYWIRSLTNLKGIVREKHGSNWNGHYQQLFGAGLKADEAEDLMLDYLRKSLPINVHFKIENLFSNILMHKNKKRKRGFAHISKAILELAGIRCDRPKNILTALASVRNSFHSNGMHENDCLSVKIGGISFKFIKGEPVKCASWDHILVLIREIISILDCILFLGNVKIVKAEIQDRFAQTITNDEL